MRSQRKWWIARTKNLGRWSWLRAASRAPQMACSTPRSSRACSSEVLVAGHLRMNVVGGIRSRSVQTWAGICRQSAMLPLRQGCRPHLIKPFCTDWVTIGTLCMSTHIKQSRVASSAPSCMVCAPMASQLGFYRTIWCIVNLSSWAVDSRILSTLGML